MSKQIRKRKEKLWREKNGKCYWCNRDTVIPPSNANLRCKPETATIDHLRTKLMKNRKQPNYTNEERTVLSCFECNQVRGILDEKVRAGYAKFVIKVDKII